MTLLHGSGGLTGKRPRIDPQRLSDPDSGPLPGSLLADSDEAPPAIVDPLARLSVDHDSASLTGSTDLPRITGDVEGRQFGNRLRIRRPAVLEAALVRLAEAGPTPADVLEVLVTDAAALLDAPARLAVATADRLVWTASCGDPSTPIGASVDIDRTACGTAWRTGQIQRVSTPAAGRFGDQSEGEVSPSAVIELDRGGLEQGGPNLSGVDLGAAERGEPLTRCCGSPAALLAVPLLRPGSRVAARHADPVREVIAVLALLADRPGWFDDADVEVAADLAEIAGERIAALQFAVHSAEQQPRQAGADSVPGRPAADSGAGPSELAEAAEPAGVEVAEELAPSAVVRPTLQLTLHAVPEPVQRPDDPARIDFDGWFAPAIPTPTALPTAPVSRLLAALRQRSRPALDSRPAPPTTTAANSAASKPEAEPGPEVGSGPDLELESEVELRSEADAPSEVELRPAAEPMSEADPTFDPASDLELSSDAEPRSGALLEARLQPRRSHPEPALPALPLPTIGSPLPRAMPAADSMGLWQWDAIEGSFTWSSPVARLLGLPPDAELTLDMIREALVGADRGRFDVAVRAIATGRGVAGALRLKTPDGRAKHAYAWSEVRRTASGAVVGAWGGVVDVTAFEHDASTLRSGLAGLRAAQELTGLATWEWRPAAGELIWSEEMYRLVGVSAEEFSPTPERWHAFIHPDDLGRARRLDRGADDQDGERVETFRLIGPGGEIRHVQSWSAPSRAGGRVITGDRSVTGDDRVIYGATIDVTRQVHDRMMLERLSATDPVTGLGNRLAYDRRMKELLAAVPSAGPAGAVTLILLDLDRFKVVNDSLGHQVGDRLLIEVARRLVAVVPEGSVTARMGGDEFVVVPPVGAGELQIRRLAIGVVDALRAPYVLPETGEMLVCPASLGIATSGGRRVSSHDLLREADIALYRAKDSGRDRFVIFDEVLKARTHVRVRAERQLREALEANRLMMEYQPVVDFTNGRIVGAEGLVRLRDAEAGDRLIAPELFLDIAEQTGLVVDVDSWVIETAIRQLAEWGAQAGSLSEPPWLAINLSARSMEHPRIVRRLIDAVKRGEVPRDRIKIELTEHSFIGALPGVEVALRQLMANGIGVGIDDFGTGYSALAYLHHFDLDFMKIDRSFVASVGEGQRGDAVVTAIVDLAHAHGMRVIAEGVESGRQARRLREMGCDFAQGFHFGRPGEAARIVRG